MWLLAALIVVAVAGAVGWMLRPRPKVIVGGPASVMALVSCTNSTGDSVMPGVVLTGLKIDLGQSTGLVIEDDQALVAGLRALSLSGSSAPAIADARQAAQAIGAAEMLLGSVSKQGSAYLVSLQVYQVSTGAKLVDVSEMAMSREQLPDTIDRLASEVRSGLGESGSSIAKTSTPLSKDATSNLEALGHYVSGTQLMASGHLIDAMHELESATSADPHFAQAYLKLAELYRMQRADVASATAAADAQKEAISSSNRTQLMAQALYASETSGDLPQAVDALQQLLAVYPDDAEGTIELARVLLMEGKPNDSLAASQKVLQRNPFDSSAAEVAERALLALDRVEAAGQVETQLERSGASHPGLRELTNYLGSRSDGQLPLGLAGQLGRLAPQRNQASVLDAGGMMQGGLQLWRAVAAQASANPELVSAAAQALAEAALDRALIGDCATTQELLTDSTAYPQAAEALFDVGMASALCGEIDVAKKSDEKLGQAYPQSFFVNGLYRPELQAAVVWKSGDPEGALKTLDGVRGFDLISLTPYLRGLILLTAKQPQQSVAHFEGTLEHRGAALLTNPVLPAMAQIGLARAFAAAGDRDRSTDSYRSFLALWSSADNGSPLVREAHVHVP